MKLNSPRTNPYSSVNTCISRLKDKDYKTEFLVIDETKVKDENDKSYHTDELIIDEVHRYTGVKDWFNNQTDVIGRVEIYALNANDGSKGYIIRSSHDEGREVIDNFLQNVDRHDNLHENYN